MPEFLPSESDQELFPEAFEQDYYEEWLLSRSEAPFADRALDGIPDEADLDDLAESVEPSESPDETTLANHEAPESPVMPTGRRGDMLLCESVLWPLMLNWIELGYIRELCISFGIGQGYGQEFATQMYDEAIQYFSEQYDQQRD